jgi:hypothetical protein
MFMPIAGVELQHQIAGLNEAIAIRRQYNTMFVFRHVRS